MLRGMKKDKGGTHSFRYKSESWKILLAEPRQSAGQIEDTGRAERGLDSHSRSSSSQVGNGVRNGFLSRKVGSQLQIKNSNFYEVN